MNVIYIGTNHPKLNYGMTGFIFAYQPGYPRYWMMVDGLTGHYYVNSEDIYVPPTSM